MVTIHPKSPTGPSICGWTGCLGAAAYCKNNTKSIRHSRPLSYLRHNVVARLGRSLVGTSLHCWRRVDVLFPPRVNSFCSFSPCILLCSVWGHTRTICFSLDNQEYNISLWVPSKEKKSALVGNTESEWVQWCRRFVWSRGFLQLNTF